LLIEEHLIEGILLRICVTHRLFKAAEEARLPKRLRGDLGGALKEFTTRESHCFAQIKDTDGGSSLFTSQERQWLVLQVRGQLERMW
jgi:hypothetical protein